MHIASVEVIMAKADSNLLPCSSHGVGSGGGGGVNNRDGLARGPIMFQAQIQGYDYEFSPQLDSKYECPICLLCQRDPTQTTCGHRFCRSCIHTWIRMEGKRCPEDNKPITEHDLFPDNFTKREILGLTVHCPNRQYGCLDTTELGKIEDHVVSCVFQVVPCPNMCSEIVLKWDLGSHQLNTCLRRTITCQLCYLDFAMPEEQEHFASCPMVTIPCNNCQALLPRKQLVSHMQTDCPKTLVNCDFYEIGCQEKLERTSLAEHQKLHSQQHLHLLMTAFRGFQFCVGKLLNKSEQESTPRSGSRPGSSGADTPQEMFGISAVAASAAGANKQQHCGSTLDFELWCEESADKFGLSTAGDQSGFPTDVTGKHAAAAVPVPNSGPRSFDDDCKKHLPVPCLSSPPELMRDLYQRNVQLEQKAREQELKMEGLRQKVLESERSATILGEKLRSVETRFCNGIYYWRVEGLSRLRTEAARGHSRVLHSPGFYTSPYGYKVCLRLNIQGKGSNGNTSPRDHHHSVATSMAGNAEAGGDSPTFLSLFIHLMHGKHDDLLDWPFVGKITLTILDQENRSDGKMDITETMHTKPGLAAFRRPNAERNPKGFGYTEFVSVDSLVSGPYLKEDKLIIRAVVTV